MNTLRKEDVVLDILYSMYITHAQLGGGGGGGGGGGYYWNYEICR